MDNKPKKIEQPMSFEEAMKKIAHTTKAEVEKEIKENSKRGKPARGKA